MTRRRLARALAAAAVLLGAVPQASAVNVLQQLEGLSNTDNVAITGFNVLPPDGNLGVGPNHVFEMVNIVGRVYGKTGTALSSFSLQSFFNVDAGFNETGPRVIYDASSGRWLATYLQFSDAATSSSIVLAVSTSSDPTGTFCRYRLGDPTSETFIQDFPMIGTSDDKVVVSYNGFSFPSATGQFLGAGYYVINKADLVGCSANLRVNRVAPSASAFTIHPAQALSSASNLYMVGVTIPPQGQPVTSVTVYTVSGVPGVSTVQTTPAVLSVRPGVPPPQAPQLGSAQLLDPGDGRIESAAWYQDSLWVAAPESCTPAGDTAARSCLRIGEIRTDTLTVRQDLTYGVSGQYYYHPALRPDASGNLHVVFSSSSSSAYMSVRVTGRLAGDALNTLQPSTELRAGAGAQTHSSGLTGDYSGAAVDPGDPLKIWVAGQYIQATSDFGWGTYIAQLQFDNLVPSIASLSPPSTISYCCTFTLTVNGTDFVPASVVRWNGSSLPTTFVSGTQLTAQVDAPLTTNAGTANVTVFTPAPGGGSSNTVIYAINNPVPVLSQLVPSSITAGFPQLFLTLSGADFRPNSTVLWNGVSRTPTFGSTGSLQLTLSSADLATGALATVAVVTPPPGGGTSGSLTFTIVNPAPTITSLSPTTVTAGGPAFTLTVNGSGFVPASVVRWNGVDLGPASFISSAQLTVSVPAAVIAGVGTASVTVFNPTPGGGVSGSATVTIIPANFPLTVSVRGSAAGTAASAPGGISCPGTCSANFASGSAVTLTATPGAGAAFKQWGGACSGSAPSCVVTMSAARTVTATFSLVFTDAALTPGSLVKAVHILELRSALEALRSQYGLGPYGWTNTLVVGRSVVRAQDMMEVRAALSGAYTAAGQAPPGFTDPTITPGVTEVKAVHITEPRNAIGPIE